MSDRDAEVFEGRVRVSLRGGMSRGGTMHVSTCARIGQFARQTACEILFRANDSVVDGRDVVRLSILAAGAGDEVTVSCRGRDAKRVWTALARFLSGEDAEIEGL